MRALVRVRRVGEAAGSDEANPPVARVGAAMERGDLAGCARRLRPVARGFARRRRAVGRCGEARAAAAKAASALRADAIGGLATAKD